MQDGEMNDDMMSSLDALLVINELNGKGSRPLGFAEGKADETFWMIDVSGDNQLSALDALLVINHLNSSTTVSFSIADAAEEVRAVAEFVTTHDGGRGAVREAVEHLLQVSGEWDDALRLFA